MGVNLIYPTADELAAWSQPTSVHEETLVPCDYCDGLREYSACGCPHCGAPLHEERPDLAARMTALATCLSGFLAPLRQAEDCRNDWTSGARVTQGAGR